MRKVEYGPVTIEMPDNGITAVGRNLIRMKLLQWNFKPLPCNWVWEWQVMGKGEYVGAFPKRVGKYYYQEHKRKLLPVQLSEIGNLASQHIPRALTYYATIQASFNWERGQFSDPDSCYWTCHKSAKNMILEEGGFTLKIYKDDLRSNERGFARCWIIPYGDQFIVANGYGLSTLAMTRIFARLMDDAYYHKIGLTNNGNNEGDLWINGQGMAYLVGEQFEVIKVSSIDLKIDGIDIAECYYCGDTVGPIDRVEYHDPGGDSCCELCYSEKVTYCFSCSKDVYTREASFDPDEGMICNSCYNKKVVTCDHCEIDRWADGESCSCEGSQACVKKVNA